MEFPAFKRLSSPLYVLALFQMGVGLVWFWVSFFVLFCLFFLFFFFVSLTQAISHLRRENLSRENAAIGLTCREVLGAFFFIDG